MKHLISAIFFLAISTGFFAQSEQLNLDWQVPVGNSNLLGLASDPVHGKTYVAGDFTRLQHQTPYTATVNLTTGLPNSEKLRPNDEILTAVPDGNGGFYIGGKFTKINGVSRKYLAHIDQNNNLTPFNVQVNYVISCLALHNGTLYFGGHFGSVNGVTRTGAAAVDATTGVLTSWNPLLNDMATDLIADGTRVIISGEFTTVGGTSRNYLCAVNPSTGALESWNPNPDNPVMRLETNGSDIYALGGFDYMSGQYKNRVCRFNATTLTLDTWTLGYSPGVPCGALFEGNTMYLYGSGLIVYNLSTNSTVSQIGSGNQIVSGTNIGGLLYFGGDFTTINGVAAQYLFRYNTGTASIESWDALPDGAVHGVVQSGSSLFLYGNFSKYGQQPASNLVVYETATGQLAANQISIDGPVDAISVQEHFLILKGLFSNVNGIAKENFAIIDLNTGQVLDFDNGIFWMGGNYRIHKDILYFTHASGVGRVPLYNDDDYQTILGLADNNGMSPVYPQDLEFYGDTLIVGGIFYFANGQSRHGCAFFDVGSNTLLSWDPGLLLTSGWPIINGWVNDIVVQGDTVYIGGQFDEAFGQPRKNLTGIDMLTGAAAGPTFTTYGSIQSMDLQGDQLTFAGAVTTNTGDNRNVFRYDLGTNQYDTWTPNPSDIIYRMELLDGTAIFTGGFTTADSTRVQSMAFFDNCRTSSVTMVSVACNYTWNGTVYTASGYYPKIFQNSQGCDSTAWLDLTILNSFSSQTVTICTPTYTSGSGAVYDSTALYTEHLTNIYGCDSLAYLDLEFYPTYDSTFVVVDYTGAYTWSATGQTYTSPGLYHSPLTTIHGCDSILHLDLSFMPAPENNEVFAEWVPDGIVYDVDHDSVNNRMILTGDFNAFRHRSYGMDLLDPVTGDPSAVMPPLSVDGSINVIVPDGNGGYFVFGSFESIGDSLRTNIAQLDANFDVTAWQTNIANFAQEVKVRGNYILAINGNICYALDKTTGDHLWTISTSGTFNTIELVDGYVYVGGDFFLLYAPDVIARSGIAQIDVTTGAVTTWAPNFNPPNAIVYDLEADGNQLYVGGTFTYLVSTFRNRVARLTVSGATTTVSSWNPGANNAVHDIEVYGSKVLLIGEFTTIGFASRAGVACVNKANNTATSFNPGASLGGGWTQKSHYLNGKLYFQFYATDVTIGSGTRSYMAAFDTVSYALTSWMPNPSEYIPLFAANGNLFACGGNQLLIGYRARPHVAALDATTLDLIENWAPAPVGTETRKATIAGTRLFVLGGNELQVFDLATGTPQALPEQIYGNNPYVLDYYDGYIYASNYWKAGSDMNEIGLQRIDTATLDFDPGFNAHAHYGSYSGAVYDVAVRDSLLYLVGSFDTIMGQLHENVACINLSTMQPTTLGVDFPDGMAIVNQVEIDNERIYLLGQFDQINNQTRHSLASIDLSTGLLTDWTPTVLQQQFLAPGMRSMVLYGNYVFAGGLIQIPVLPRAGIAMASKYSNLPMEFTMEGYADVQDLCLVGDRLHAGGLFNASGVMTHHYRTFDFCNNESTISDTTYEPVYSWNGGNLTTTGTYFQTIPNATGCDSIVTLRLTCLPPYVYDTVSVTTCGTYTWPLNGETYVTGGLYNDTLAFPNGVDSVTVLELVLLNELVTTQTEIACDTFFWDNTGMTYSVSGIYTDTLLSLAGCDSIVALDLTILDPTTASITVSAAGTYTWPLNGMSYTASGTYTDTIPNAAGCDSIVTLNLIVSPAFTVNTFSLPSDANDCTGGVSLLADGVPDFTIDPGNGSAPVTTSGYLFVDSLCPGIYSAFITDGNGDTLSTIYVIPADSNYVFNNPFIDSLVMDSIGSTIENCIIDYNSIDSAYIAAIFANADTVTVTWAIIDSSGLSTIETTYVLGNGAGVYDLQLSIFCPQKSTGAFFVVTQSIYFDGSDAHVAALPETTLSDIGIYPNPTDGLVNITFSGPGADLTIFDAQGKLIAAEQGIQSGHTVSLKALPSGVYFFSLSTSYGTTMKRVVKH